MNNPSFANPFGPHGSSTLSNPQMGYNAQSLPQLLTGNNMNIPNNNTVTNVATNPCNTNAMTMQSRNNPSTSYSNMTSSMGSIDLGAMLQNFGLLKPHQLETAKANPISSIIPNNHQQNNNNNSEMRLNTNQNKHLLQNVLGHLSNFNGNNINKQNLFKKFNSVDYNHLFKQNKAPNHLDNTNNNEAINNVISQLAIPQTLGSVHHTQTQTRNSTNQTPQNPLFSMQNTESLFDGNTQTQNINNNPYFKNVANFGMNLNITSTSQQIPLVDIQKTDSKPLILLNDDKKEQEKVNETEEKKEEKENKKEHHEVVLIDDDEDKSSISSSSSSNVEQFLDSLQNENHKKRKYHKKRSISKEPPTKKRKLISNECSPDDIEDEFEFDLMEETDEKYIKKYSDTLEEIKKDTMKHFSLASIKRPAFIFKRLRTMYPHFVYSKLLKYEEEQSKLSRGLTASQLLALYTENVATMRMYKEYIHLPSVVPITLPVIDGKMINAKSVIKTAFIVQNWWDLNCKFPENCSYLDLLVQIGATTSIRVIDNITNCEIEDDMKLYQYLYLLSASRPSRREYSLNLISLEISGSILDRYIVRPSFIRDIDWISPSRHCWFKSCSMRKYYFSTANNLKGIVDNVENKNLFYIEDGIKSISEEEECDELEQLKLDILLPQIRNSGFPEIQKYVLISSANSFTEWHTDFNGSCVWYYMAKGTKYFYIISPSTPAILEEYRKWRSQSDIQWFPEYAQCTAQLVVVKQNELLILPSGTIHCVFTPVDSVAFSGNWLCDDNIQIQLRIEHLYHQIYSNNSVPCCHYFRDLNALRVIEFYYDLKKKKKLNKKDKENAIDLCIQIIFWMKEEKEYHKKDLRLCKFDLCDINKLKPKIYDTLNMCGCNIKHEMKKFIKKYPHYKPPNNCDDDDEEEDQEEEEEEQHDDESDYDINEEEEEEEEEVEDIALNARKRSLRSARNKKEKKKSKNNKRRVKKKKKSKNDKIECFKCGEKSPRRHMVLFVCCDTYYHLRCAGYTTPRTQRAIQQHIDNGTINKQCPVCVKKGRQSK